MEHLDEQVLEEVVRRLREGFSPDAIYLYGSHAYGSPHEDSDVDLLVVVPESDEPSYERARQAHRLLRGMHIPAEIRVVTREEFEEYGGWISSVERVVQEKGVPLYRATAG